MLALRDNADLRTLVFVAAYYAITAFHWLAAPESLVLAVPLYIALCFSSFQTAVITHNTLHCAVFKRRTLNRLFQAAISLGYGHPVSSYVPGHNLSHHKYMQTPKDIMRTTKLRHSWNFLNGALFFSTISRDIFMSDVRYFLAMYKRNRGWFWQFIFEFSVVIGVTLTLFILDWKKAILYWMIPHLFAQWAIVSMNFLQHDGCDTESAYNHSRNFMSPVLNWLLVNNGYHTIHHMQPAAHWSKLPQLHAELVRPHMHPALEEQSMLGYMFKAFIYPGKRLRYDGKPVVLPPEGPDDNWLPAPGEANDVSFGTF